jgi:predicted lipase
VFVVFRGTKNTENWMRNLAIVRLRFPDQEVCPTCAVHAGIFNSLKELQPLYMKIIQSYKSQFNPQTKIVFTGHSLGGALATVAALEFTVDAEKLGINPKNMKLITFGAPVVGNDVLAA